MLDFHVLGLAMLGPHGQNMPKPPEKLVGALLGIFWADLAIEFGDSVRCRFDLHRSLGELLESPNQNCNADVTTCSERNMTSTST